MHPESIEALRKYQVNDAEVQQVLIAGNAGMSERELCRAWFASPTPAIAYPAEGDVIAGLLGAGVKESSVMALVRLDQLTRFGGEAEAMHLAELSDDVILEVARRRAKGEAVLSGSRLAELRDAGFSNTQLVAALDRGISDKQAEEAIAYHNYAAGGHSFVRQSGHRR